MSLLEGVHDQILVTNTLILLYTHLALHLPDIATIIGHHLEYYPDFSSTIHTVHCYP